MEKFPKINASLYYLADTTLSTTDSFANNDDQVKVGSVVGADGKVSTGQDDAFAIVNSLNAAKDGVVINRNFSAYSHGRVWVETSAAVTVNTDAFYTIATGKYGLTGDIRVGKFLTAGETPNVIQIDMTAKAAATGG